MRLQLTHVRKMSEEIENAALNVPRAIFITMILNGSTGFAMVLAVLFCIGDIESALVSNQHLTFDFCADNTARNRRQASRSFSSSITQPNRMQEQRSWWPLFSRSLGVRQSDSQPLRLA